VSRGSFIPVPNVDSSVIKIDIDKDKRYGKIDEEFFFKVVKAGFSQRRKTLANSLSAMLGISKEIIYEILSDIGLNQAVRVESLTMDELVLFSEKLKNSLN
jgi:16S rRNA (adenine1518-N6/adenine1519-N6)-dimethyltransferase